MDNTDEELVLSMLEKERQSGSSARLKRRSVIDRSREEGHRQLFNDYFSENPIYTDEYVRIGESSAVECLERFVRGVNEAFGVEYLRRPNTNDFEHLIQMGESRGFPGMLGSIDCMHWEWKNCLVALK
ncbi:uncharacterized protein LOC131618846 [Vicia villosa]|uniref:uncharacterized protein LOC131618846 n=1 Tax=Vicia villosa TaxID=3911 RepID=UPI00273B53DB|nr:uncharacterized protein LOC131618846 [Vicia villosa]